MNTLFGMNMIIWNEIELFGMKLKYIEIFRINMNKKACPRSVPIRNVPLHTEEPDCPPANCQPFERIVLFSQHLPSLSKAIFTYLRVSPKETIPQ